MKTKFYTLLAGMYLFILSGSQAAVLRVNNDPNVTAPYSTFNAAQTAASPGDTIYLEGTSISYGNLTFSKKLILIGPGYFLSQNPQTQSNVNSATVTDIYLSSVAANGSKIMGIIVSSYVYINSSTLQDIELSRNLISYCANTGGGTLNNITLKQNYIGVITVGNLHNSLIFNNIISGSFTFNSPSNSVAVFNNVFLNNINITNIQFFNNIQTAGSATLTNTNAYNNLCSATQFPAGNNNQQNVNMSNVFVCWSSCTGYSTDGRYQLKAGSPAIGAGANGEDCGIFGGSEPYVLSGMPAIPAIYSFQYNNNNAVINVTMSAKSHN